MPKFRTQKQVPHSAQKMFALVADIERYPEFLPMCESLIIRSRREENGNILLVADMSVGYKLVRESFTTQVYLQPAACRIDVQYIDGPFKYLQNRWQFLPLGAAAGSDNSGAAGAKGAAGAARSGAAQTVVNAGNGEAGAASGTVKTEAAGAGGKTRTTGVVGETAADQAARAADSAAGGHAMRTANPIITMGSAESCIVDFYIDYAFKNPMLSMLMGAMFDIAFRKFTAAFITRADEIYGVNN